MSDNFGLPAKLAKQSKKWPASPCSRAGKNGSTRADCFERVSSGEFNAKVRALS